MKGREREVAAQQEDINSVNAVIRANPKYRASIKHGTKIIICTGLSSTRTRELP